MLGVTVTQPVVDKSASLSGRALLALLVVVRERPQCEGMQQGNPRVPEAGLSQHLARLLLEVVACRGSRVGMLPPPVGSVLETLCEGNLARDRELVRAARMRPADETQPPAQVLLGAVA